MSRRSRQAPDAGYRRVAQTQALTLEYLYQLALNWCPTKARWPHLLESANAWGPVHELAHALIELKWRWVFQDYGHCALGFCSCGRNLCTVYEAAAMTISGTILRSMHENKLADQEVQNTSDYDLIEYRHFDQAKALLRRKKLWPVPTTRRALETALRRRLGRPRGNGKPPPVGPWENMVQQILGPS